MFVTTKQLVTQYSLDDTIARFFVDREPPINNLYWHEKLIYLRPSPGYLFIPLIVDLLFKIGIDRQLLLSEEFVTAMENIGHISALEETKKISKQEAIEECSNLITNVCKNESWLKEVMNYLLHKKKSFLNTLATPFNALHRGDLFLFSLSVIPFSTELFEKIAKQWFALISTLLLLDDAEDIEIDKKANDENAFVESGLNAEGLRRISSLVTKNIEEISSINSAMANELGRQFKERSQMPDICKLLNQ